MILNENSIDIIDVDINIDTIVLSLESTCKKLHNYYFLNSNISNEEPQCLLSEIRRIIDIYNAYLEYNSSNKTLDYVIGLVREHLNIEDESTEIKISVTQQEINAIHRMKMEYALYRVVAILYDKNHELKDGACYGMSKLTAFKVENGLYEKHKNSPLEQLEEFAKKNLRAIVISQLGQGDKYLDNARFWNTGKDTICYSHNRVSIKTISAQNINLNYLRSLLPNLKNGKSIGIVVVK